MGTRFLPATKASAKEMMPVVDKPLIQYAVEEAVAAGMRSTFAVAAILIVVALAIASVSHALSRRVSDRPVAVDARLRGVC